MTSKNETYVVIVIQEKSDGSITNAVTAWTTMEDAKAKCYQELSYAHASDAIVGRLPMCWSRWLLLVERAHGWTRRARVGR